MKGFMLAVCCALALLVPAAAASAAPSSASKRGTVAVGAKIKRFAVVDRKIVARGVLTSRVTGGGETKAARTPVTFAVAAQAGRCHVLTLNLKDLQLSLLGLNVDLSEVNLRIFAVRRGADSGILGRLFCALSRSSVRLGRGAGAARAHEVVHSLNSRLKDHPMRAFRATAVVTRAGDASAAQAAPSCKVLHLTLGPLDLNLLGLVVQLYGANPRQPVTLDITATPNAGVLGDLFCSVSGGPTP
jgi:hypothetical protein